MDQEKKEQILGEIFDVLEFIWPDDAFYAVVEKQDLSMEEIKELLGAFKASAQYRQALSEGGPGYELDWSKYESGDESPVS